jgi:hypothetical protein
MKAKGNLNGRQNSPGENLHAIRLFFLYFAHRTSTIRVAKNAEFALDAR